MKSEKAFEELRRRNRQEAMPWGIYNFNEHFPEIKSIIISNPGVDPSLSVSVISSDETVKSCVIEPP